MLHCHLQGMAVLLSTLQLHKSAVNTPTAKLSKTLRKIICLQIFLISTRAGEL